MPNLSVNEVQRWQVEVDQAERFRDEQFGKYTANEVKGVGENIQYADYGLSQNTIREFATGPSEIQPFATVNIIHPILRNIIPSLYYQNPKVLAMPKRKEDEESASLAAQILNYYHKELNIKDVIQLAIWDAYVLGMGVIKVGYATQFGADIPDDDEKKRKQKAREKGLLARLGLIRPPKEEEPKENIELNEFIRAESPYLIWVSPFDFLIDPRASSINTASWVAHHVKKTLREVKANPNYKNTRYLNPSPLEKLPQQYDITDTQIENFQTVDLYEIHYKTDEGISILTLAKDQDTQFKELRHQENVYDIDGFQFEVLTFNKHGHRLYPRSDVSMVRGLQDRITTTFDNILDQVDRFVSKILVDRTKLEPGGEKALEDGNLGSIVYCNSDIDSVAKELSLTQLKGELAVLIERIVDMICLIVGLTRAQLTGLTTAETATEAQIGQTGQNLRRGDQANTVIDFVNRSDRKLWQVIAQFVDFEELQIITGEPMQDQMGNIKYNWLTISPEISEKLNKGEYSFDIEVMSAQRPNVEVIRQQASNMVRDLFNPVVEQILTQEGSHLNHTEILRALFKLFPEFIKNPERILQQATPQQQQMGLMQQMQPSNRGRGMENAGLTPNVPPAPPTPTTIQEQVMGEQKGGFSGV